MSNENISIHQFTEIMNGELMKTARNLHLIAKKIDMLSVGGVLFYKSLLKRCLEEIGPMLDSEYKTDYLVIKEFFENPLSPEKLQDIAFKYQSTLVEKVEQIGPFVVEVMEDDLNDRQGAFYYPDSIMPISPIRDDRKGTLASYFFGPRDLIFPFRINEVQNIPDHVTGASYNRKGLYLKPNPKYPKGNSFGPLKFVNSIVHDPYVEVKGDDQIFKEARNKFEEKFVGPEKSEFIREQKNLVDLTRYLQKMILAQTSLSLLMFLKDDVIQKKLKDDFKFTLGSLGEAWIRVFCSCCSLVGARNFEKKLQIIPKPNSTYWLDDNECMEAHGLLKSRFKFHDFSIYKENQFSTSVEIPEFLKIALIKSYENYLSPNENQDEISGSVVVQLEKLAHLKNLGHLSDSEFLSAKKKILDL